MIRIIAYIALLIFSLAGIIGLYSLTGNPYIAVGIAIVGLFAITAYMKD